MKLNKEQMLELLDDCAERGMYLTDMFAYKLGFRNSDGVRAFIEKAINGGDVTTLKRLITAGMLVRANGKAYINIIAFGYFSEMDRDLHRTMIELFIEAGEYRLARKFTTREVRPVLAKLTPNVEDYLFIEQIPGIKTMAGLDATILFSDADSARAAAMTLDGLRKLKAFYEERIAGGEDIAHIKLETEPDPDTGMQRLKSGYIEKTENGRTVRVYYRGVYSRLEPIYAAEFMTEEQVRELRLLQAEIENLINYI